MSRKLVLYIACSVDGFIAGPGDDLSFLDAMQTEGEDYGYGELLSRVDTVLMGRKTYDWVMSQVAEFPHAGMPSYIITRSSRPSSGNIHFYNGSLSELIEKLKAQPGKDIFVDGGAALVNALLREELLDELIISVVPVLLGDGVRLFEDGGFLQNLHLKDSQHFSTGLVQLKYELKPKNRK